MILNERGREAQPTRPFSRSAHVLVIDHANFNFHVCRYNKLSPMQITVATGSR